MAFCLKSFDDGLCDDWRGSFGRFAAQVGYVTVAVVIVNAIVAALLTSGLACHTALIMQELTLTRVEMQRVSCTDQLTGLLNRRGFDAAALVALTKANEANLPVVALMRDIDRFKSINDQFGHEFGDKVLIKMGDVLRSFADTTEIMVARHGGEEFAALVIGVDNEKALQYAERLRQASATEVSHEGASTRVTVSIGIASPQRDAGLPTMMRFADKALYAAKHRGRNRSSGRYVDGLDRSLEVRRSASRLGSIGESRRSN